MSRRYTITEPALTVSATMSLAQINGASGKIVEVVRWWWKAVDNTLPTAQNLQTRARLLPATVSNGSGGNASPSIQPNDGGDAGATFTARTRDTALATTTGTARVYYEGGAHIYNGDDQQPENPITVKSGEAFVFEMTSSSVQNAPKISIGVEVDEIG
jgi:hypothetical protein